MSLNSPGISGFGYDIFAGRWSYGSKDHWPDKGHANAEANILPVTPY